MIGIAGHAHGAAVLDGDELGAGVGAVVLTDAAGRVGRTREVWAEVAN